MSGSLSGSFDRIFLKGEKMNQENIGKFLKKPRKQKGLTQEQIAEKFHVSNRTYPVGKTATICQT